MVAFRRTAFLWYGWLLPCLLACADATPERSKEAGEGLAGGLDVIDSAGIQLVVNRAPGKWEREGGRWRVEEDAAIAGSIPLYNLDSQGRWLRERDPGIGGLPNPYQTDAPDRFGRVLYPVTGDSRGRIFFLTWPLMARFFEPGGEQFSGFSKVGAGRGQYGSPIALLPRPGDTLWVPDPGNRRMNLLILGSPDTLPALTIRGWSGAGCRDWAALGGGRFMCWYASAEWEGLLRLDYERGTVDTMIGGFDPRKRPTPGEHILDPWYAWAMSERGEVAYGRTDVFRITVADAEGRPLRVVTMPRERRATTPGERQQLERIWAEPISPAMLASLRESLMLSAPDEWPAFAGLMFGPENTIWVLRIPGVRGMDEDYLRDRTNPRKLKKMVWDVFDAAGAYLGEIELPDGVSVHTCTGEYLYGVRREPDGNDVLVRMRITKN